MRSPFFALAVTLAIVSPLAAQDTPPISSPQAPAPAQPQDPELAAGNDAIQKEDWEAAVKSFEASLAKGNHARIVHFRLGYALHMLKRYDEALKHHLLAIPIATRALRIDALYNAACAHALLGHKDEAKKFLQYAIDAGFSDLDQVGKDTDLDSLRSDDGFKKLVDGIGKTPRLDQQLDFFLGTWTSDTGEPKRSLAIRRPLPGSQGIATTSSATGGASWTGLLSPNPIERTWTWTSIDGMGSTLTLTGSAIEPGGFRFEGVETSVGGKGARVRMTLTPHAAGGITEKVEVSEEGAAWRPHHEVKYTKAAAPAKADEAP